MAKKRTAPQPPKKKKSVAKTVYDILTAPFAAGQKTGQALKSKSKSTISKAKTNAKKQTQTNLNRTAFDEGFGMMGQLMGLNKKKKK